MATSPKVSKFLSVEYVHKCFEKECCKASCLKHWSFFDLQNHLKINCALPDAEKRMCVNKLHNFTEAKLVEILASSQHNDGTHTIKGQKYSLKVFGKSVCPTAFCQIYGISINTLNKLAAEKYVDLSKAKEPVCC